MIKSKLIFNFIWLSIFLWLPMLNAQNDSLNFKFLGTAGWEISDGAVTILVSSLYLIPSLVQIDKAKASKISLPTHLKEMLPEVIANEPTAKMLFLAEGLKAEKTGKQTSSAEMSKEGVWGERDPKEATAKRGAADTKRVVDAAVKFIDKWNELVPMKH